MSDHENMNGDWEARINALLDGELDARESAALKREAEENQALAQAIVDAYALQARLDQLEIERAPASLSARLARIPKTESKARKSWFGMPRWAPVGAIAAIPLVVIAMVMMQSEPEVPEYTEAEILQATQDVRTAFAYLDRIGARAAREIEAELAKELRSGVNDNVTKHMPFTNHSRKEENS